MPHDEIIPKGSDRQINFTLTYSNGNPIHLSNDISGLMVVLYTKQGQTRTTVEQYSKNAVSGFNNNDLVIVTAASGIFYVRLQAEKTRTARVGPLYVEIKAKFDSVDYSSNDFHDIVTDLEIAQIRDSILGSQQSM